MKVTKEEFEKAGGDPLKIERIAKELANIPRAVRAEEQREEEDSQEFTDAMEMMPEGAPLFPKVAGVQIVRDITAGVFNMLVKMESPLVTGKELQDDNEYLEVMSFLLYLLSAEDVSGLVRDFIKGELWEKFLIWSFENVNINLLMEEQKILEKMMEEIGGSIAETPEIKDQKNNKKKSVG